MVAGDHQIFRNRNNSNDHPTLIIILVIVIIELLPSVEVTQSGSDSLYRKLTDLLCHLTFLTSSLQAPDLTDTSPLNINVKLIKTVTVCHYSLLSLTDWGGKEIPELTVELQT